MPGLSPNKTEVSAQELLNSTRQFVDRSNHIYQQQMLHLLTVQCIARSEVVAAYYERILHLRQLDFQSLGEATLQLSQMTGGVLMSHPSEENQGTILGMQFDTDTGDYLTMVEAEGIGHQQWLLQRGSQLTIPSEIA